MNQGVAGSPVGLHQPPDELLNRLEVVVARPEGHALLVSRVEPVLQDLRIEVSETVEGTALELTAPEAASRILAAWSGGYMRIIEISGGPDLADRRTDGCFQVSGPALGIRIFLEGKEDSPDQRDQRMALDAMVRGCPDSHSRDLVRSVEEIAETLYHEYCHMEDYGLYGKGVYEAAQKLQPPKPRLGETGLDADPVLHASELRRTLQRINSAGDSFLSERRKAYHLRLWGKYQPKYEKLREYLLGEQRRGNPSLEGLGEYDASLPSFGPFPSWR